MGMVIKNWCVHQVEENKKPLASEQKIGHEQQKRKNFKKSLKSLAQNQPLYQKD